MAPFVFDDVSIDTPRLHLRPLVKEDVSRVLEWARDQDVVKNFSFFAGGVDAARVAAYIEAKQASPADLLLAVFERVGGSSSTPGTSVSTSTTP